MRLYTGVTLAIFVAGLLSAGHSPAAELSSQVPEKEPVLKLSLRDAIEAALDKNPNVRLYKERIEAARGVTATNLGALLPNLASSARYNNQTFFRGSIAGSPTRSQPFDITDARGTLSQSLFSWSLIERWRASRAALAVAEGESDTTQNDTMATVALNYMEVLRNHETVAARAANVELYKELVSYIKSRQSGGMATGLDTARLETQLENERQRLELAKSDVERTKLILINALGINFDSKLVLTDELKAPEEPIPTQEHATEVAFSERPEVKAQEQRVQVSTLMLSSIKGERLPSLQAQGDFGLIGNRVDSTLSTYNVGLTLSIPIFDGGQREGRIGEGRSRLLQEEIKMNIVTRQITMELREALVTLTSAKEQLKIAKDGLKSALTEVQLARERVRVLNSNSLELSNSLLSLVRARDNMIDGLFRANASRVNLARAMGQVEELR
ncbi:MAG: TolC family protein [Nitrospiraceae bacterium]|nr:TolC family protein [Nitrospiraceae bacterium]